MAPSWQNVDLTGPVEEDDEVDGSDDSEDQDQCMPLLQTRPASFYARHQLNDSGTLLCATSAGVVA